MRNNNVIRVRGNLVKDPVVFADKNFAMLRVAVNYQAKEKQEAMYFDVKLFGDRLKDIDYFELSAGDRVVVDGSMALDVRTKDEKTYTDMVVYCETIEKIWRKSKTTTENTSVATEDSGPLSGKF